MLDTTTLTSITSAGKISPLTVITGINYNKNLLKIFNNLTFLYDPNWVYQEEEPSFPIAFYFVKQETVQMTSDISTKPLLFYNTASDARDSTHGGMMDVIADNIINKPQEYHYDIIIPANNTTAFRMYNSFESMVSINDVLFTQGSSLQKAGLNIAFRAVNISMGVLQTLFKALYGLNISASVISNMIFQQQDYNKASIETMWKTRKIIKMKMWNGWKFKYLAIKSFDVTKTGDLGEYFEGRLVLQEVPIMTFRQQKETSLFKLSEMSSFMGKKIGQATNVFINAMTTTADSVEKTEVPMNKIVTLSR